MVSHIPKIRSREAHPWNWPTCIDMIAPLGIQCRPGIAPEAEVYFLDTYVSYAAGKVESPKKSIQTRTGIISPPPAELRQVIPFTSETDPSERVYSHKEIFDDIQSSGISEGLSIPSAGGVIHRQGLRIDVGDFIIPTELAEQGYLDGCTHVLVDNVYCATWPGFLESHFNVSVPSLTRRIRNELVYNNILKRCDLPPAPRMRSILQMRSILGLDIDNKKLYGFTEILTNERANTLPSETLSDSLGQDKFFKDTALPRQLPRFDFDGHASLPRAYELKKGNIPVILKLGPDWETK